MDEITGDVHYGEIDGAIETHGSIEGGIEQKGSIGGDLNAPETKTVIEKDYNKLNNKPSIEHVTLEGNKELEDIGITEITNQQISDIMKKVFGG